ncbi:MAG: glycosyltransferase [Bacteroidales bacterium]
MIKTIAFIHQKYPFGGGERVTSLIASFLKNNGFKVYVFVGELDSEFIMRSDNISIEFLLLPDANNINATINRDFVLRSIKDRSIDLFIDPSINITYLKDIKSQGGCKVIYVLHGRPLWEVLFKPLIGKVNSKTSVFKFVEWWILRYPKYKLFNSCERRFVRKYRELYNVVDFYGTLCKDDSKSIANILGIDLNGSRIGVLTNPVYKDQEANMHKKKQLLYVGRIECLNLNKRVDHLIDIWSYIYKEFSDWELVIVGDGPGLSQIESMVDKRGIERVIFHGYHKNVVPYLQEASIICMTSIYEGWPLALVEAQAYGVIPISYNCSDGVKEIIGEQNQYGVLVKDYDQKEYVESLRDLMQDDFRRESLSRSVLEKSMAYDIETIGKQWIDMIDSLS